MSKIFFHFLFTCTQNPESRALEPGIGKRTRNRGGEGDQLISPLPQESRVKNHKLPMPMCERERRTDERAPPSLASASASSASAIIAIRHSDCHVCLAHDGPSPSQLSTSIFSSLASLRVVVVVAQAQSTKHKKRTRKKRGDEQQQHTSYR